MKYLIEAPKDINGVIKLPASKSISNRALIMSALAINNFEINNISDCDDTKVMLEAFKFESNEIDVKAAGTSMRFLTAFFSLLPGEWALTGSKRMKERPISILVNALRELGANIEYLENDGYPPLLIKGCKLDGGEITLDGSISSQFISALMMIAPSMSNGLTIKLEGEITSIPYIKLTQSMQRKFGVGVFWQDNIIKIPHVEYEQSEFLVESDWSAASYWFEMVALADSGSVKLLGLFEDSYQGDSKILELFKDLGVTSQFVEDGLILSKSEILTKKFFYDFSDIPDLAQTFAVTCCMLGIPFLFSGLKTLKIKETDRINALKVELKKLGFVLYDRDDCILEWDGEKCPVDQEATIDTYDDHRMAMSIAPAVLKMKSLLMNDPAVISKSYPNYWNDLKSVGFTIKEI